MIGTKMRQARTCLLAGSLVSMFAASCAAPDAQPGPPDEPVVANRGDPQWALGFGESTADQHAYDVALDPSTDTFVMTLGFFSSIVIPGLADDLPFLPGGVSRNILVTKYAATGSQPLWALALKSDAEMIRSVVDIDFQGNTIVAGGYNGTLAVDGHTPRLTVGSYDAYIVKISPSGQPLWVHTFGNNMENFITDVATDGDGNIIVVGFARGDAFDFGPGVSAANVSSEDIFVAKLDSAGTALWAKRVGRAGSPDWFDPTATVAVSRADGSVIVGGTHSDTLVFPPLQLPLLGIDDGFVVKLDAQGNGLWQKTFGTKDRWQRVADVAYAPSGEVLLTGSFSGEVSLGGSNLEGYINTFDLLVAKLDANGEHVWSRGYGHDGKQLGNHVSLDARGNVVVIGTFDGVIELFDKDAIISANVASSSTDVFAAKFSPNGTPLWGRAYGDRETQNTGGAVLWTDSDGEDRAIVVGMNRGTMSAGAAASSAISTGLEDAFVMSIAH